MLGLRPQFFFVVLVAAALVAISCGVGTAHLPQSVSVSPATADGGSGPIQFMATAYYNTMPSPVNSVPATWGACSANANANANISDVSVSATGKAQCFAGANQTYIIYASVPIPGFRGVCGSQAGEQLPCGGSCGTVVGTALLTCP